MLFSVVQLLVVSSLGNSGAAKGRARVTLEPRNYYLGHAGRAHAFLNFSAQADYLFGSSYFEDLFTWHF